MVADQDIQSVVRGLVAELADVPVETVADDTRLVEDLDIDSITRVEMAVRLRADTGRDIPDSALLGLDQVRDVVTYVKERT